MSSLAKRRGMSKLSPALGEYITTAYAHAEKRADWGALLACPGPPGAARGTQRAFPWEVESGYKVEALIGVGSMCSVRQVTSLSSGRQMAMKILSSQDEEKRHVMLKEYRLMTKLQHPAIVRAYELFEDSRHMCIIMDICAGGSVQAYVARNGTFSEGHTRSLVAQLFMGVDCLHRMRVVHRDLKADNLLLDACAGTLKICDFNSAKQIGEFAHGEVMLTDRGTEDYRAPELLLGQFWNERVDIWASGLCLYFMAKGQLPFSTKEPSVKRRLAQGELPVVAYSGMSVLMRNLISQCLAVDMRDRPPVMELQFHPFFVSQGNGTGPGDLPAGVGLASGSSAHRQWSCPNLAALASEPSPAEVASTAGADTNEGITGVVLEDDPLVRQFSKELTDPFVRQYSSESIVSVPTSTRSSTAILTALAHQKCQSMLGQM